MSRIKSLVAFESLNSLISRFLRNVMAAETEWLNVWAATLTSFYDFEILHVLLLIYFLD